MARTGAALTALVAALALAGCGAGTTSTAGGETTTTTTPADVTAPAEPASPSTSAPAGEVAVPEHLDFVVEDVRGGQVAGADFAGRELVIWFWAPW